MSAVEIIELAEKKTGIVKSNGCWQSVSKSGERRPPQLHVLYANARLRHHRLCHSLDWHAYARKRATLNR